MQPKLKRNFKRFAIVLFLLLFAFIIFILNETKDEIKANFTNIDSKLEEFQRDDRNVGFAVSVFTKDSVLFQKGYGYSNLKKAEPYTAYSRQYIASVSKTTIGVALLKAQELGLLHLDDPINDHLPFAVINPNYPHDAITIKQLATHTASLDYNEAVVESLYISEKEKQASLAAFMQAYFQKNHYGPVTFMDEKPGTIFNYSNIGAGLAAFIIEYKSKMTFDEFTEKYIFEPLELTQTAWFLEDKDSLGISSHYEFKNEKVQQKNTQGVILYPARDLITNVADLTTYTQAVMRRSKTLLSSESYKQLLEPQLKASVTNDMVDNSGVFWMMDRNQYGVTYELTGMNGGDSDINTMMWFDPITEIGYIFIGNTGQFEKNRVNHIWIFRTLVSLGDHYVMESSNFSFIQKSSFRWHNIYSRLRGLF